MSMLATATSAYLRSAKDQPVDWYPWGPEPFARAKADNKPILLDIGAVWCHWCHVMDHESYEDPAIAEFLNRDWICIKVDRDERPDVDARYQRAVQAISGQGGWPLTAFLTPDGEVFYGGTYFPPDGKYGRPGFAAILAELSRRYHEDPQMVTKQAADLTAHITPEEGIAEDNDLDPALLDKISDAMAHAFDFRYGGFGTLPKFPHAGAIDFLTSYWFDSQQTWAREMVERTLSAMANGGIYDQLGGGFHRYSVDARWHVPHFEKMSYDNSELLKAYASAHSALADLGDADVLQQFHDVIAGIVRWVMSTMSHPDGGYFASQDADVGPDDDGDYFTWTTDETRAAVSPDEFDVISRYYDVVNVGDMHHNPAKNVLRRSQTATAIAKEVGSTEETVNRLIGSARGKMLEARYTRPTPFIDDTLYTGWNAMMASAILSAAPLVDREDLDDHAIATLELLFRNGTRDSLEDGVRHAPGSEISGILDDHVQLATASIDAFEVTGDGYWLQRAETLMTHAVAEYATESGGLRDANIADDEPDFLRQEIRPVQDSPTPSPNGVAAIVLSRLLAHTGNEEWRTHRDRILKPHVAQLVHLGVFGATMARALDWAVRHVCHIVIVGHDDARELHATARRVYRPRKVITRLRPSESSDHLPHALRAMVDGSSPRAYVCCGTSCAAPVQTTEQLKATLRTFQIP